MEKHPEIATVVTISITKHVHKKKKNVSDNKELNNTKKLKKLYF